MFLVLKDNSFFFIEKAKYFGYFYSIFFFEISAINHEKVKKQTIEY